MSLTADIDAARLSVLLDLRQPLAYLALHPTIAFGRLQSQAVNWLPIAVPPLRAASAPRPDDDRGTRHRRYRAQAIAREIACYAEAQALVLRDPYRTVEAACANLAWLWLRDRHAERLEDYLALLFRSYWALALDPSCEEQVAGLVAAVDADPDGFRIWSADEGPQAAAALAEELQQRGLFQAPAFLVEDEVFYGRQHLPMIRWILDGRSTGSDPGLI